jgi:hypothetical protein
LLLALVAPCRAALLSLGLLASVSTLWGCSAVVGADELQGGCNGDSTLCCSEEQKVCEGRCVNLSNPAFGCDSDGCDPCDIPNATAVCSSTGTCRISTCVTGFDDCNGQPGDGCEANLAVDLDNCGVCDNICLFPGGEGICGGAEATRGRGECELVMCDRGRESCSDDGRTKPASQGNVSSGEDCETDITDEDNCGSCDNECDNDQTCEETSDTVWECVTAAE